MKRENQAVLRIVRAGLLIGFSCALMVGMVRPQFAVARDDNSFDSEADEIGTKRVDEIDRAVVFEFIKLSRFNIKYHLEANRHQKWRGLTYPALRESGTAVGMAASIADMRQRVNALDDPATVSRSELRHVAETALVGTTISGAASSMELAQNTWVMLKARKSGYSPKDSLAFVKSTSATIDALLDEREQIVTEKIPQRKQRVFEVEGTLFRRIHQQLLMEFRKWSIHSREQAWRENTFYTLDAAQNFTRSASFIIALRAFRHPEIGGAGVISGLVANSIATVNPLFRNFVGVCVRKYQRKKLEKELDIGKPISSQVVALSELRQRELAKDPRERKASVLDEAIMLSERSERLDVHLDRETREIERYRQVAQQQSFSGPLIGLTGVASSVLGTIVFYDFRTDRHTSASLLYAARVTQLTGQGYAIIDTPYTILAGYIRNRRLAKRGELPSQILAQRLKNLDSFEERLKTTHFP